MVLIIELQYVTHNQEHCDRAKNYLVFSKTIINKLHRVVPQPSHDRSVSDQQALQIAGLHKAQLQGSPF